MRTQWNDREHEALRGLSMLAQLLYLRVFRRRMNYHTAIAGGPGRHINTQSLMEDVAFIPDTRSNKKAWRPTRGELRAAIAELERPRWLDPDDQEPVVLLLDMGSTKDEGYVKKCVLADTDSSAQNMNNPRTTQEQPREQPRETQPEQQLNEYERHGSSVAPIQQPRMSNPPSGDTGEQEEEEPPLPPKPKPEAWTIPGWLNADAWAEFEQHRRDMRKPLTDLARTKAAKQLQALSHAEQQACIDRSIQSRWAGLFPEKTAKPYQPSKASRVAEANRAAGDEFVNGDRVIQGQFRRVQS